MHASGHAGLKQDFHIQLVQFLQKAVRRNIQQIGEGFEVIVAHHIVGEGRELFRQGIALQLSVIFFQRTGHRVMVVVLHLPQPGFPGKGMVSGVGHVEHIVQLGLLGIASVDEGNAL